MMTSPTCWSKYCEEVSELTNKLDCEEYWSKFCILLVHQWVWYIRVGVVGFRLFGKRKDLNAAIFNLKEIDTWLDICICHRRNFIMIQDALRSMEINLLHALET